MKIESNVEEYKTELQDLCKLFGDDLEIEISVEEKSIDNKIINDFEISYNKQIKRFSYSYLLDPNLSELRKKSYRKRQVKNFLYLMLSKELNKTLPWGSLTGVRPTKFARDLVENGEIKDYLISESLEKIILYLKKGLDLFQ